MPLFEGDKDNRILRLTWTSGKLALVISLIAGATIIALGFRMLGFHESNIIILYLLVCLLTSYWFEGYLYGIFSSVLSVLTFNYFFAEPYYSFLVYRMDYPVTFTIMIMVVMIGSTMTNRLKKETRLSNIREKRAYVLYKMSQGLLRAQNIDEICHIVGKEVSSVLNIAVIVKIKEEDRINEHEWIYFKGANDTKALFISDEQRDIQNQVFQSGEVIIYKKQHLDELDFYYAPITGQTSALGILGISLKPDEIIYEEKKVLIQAMTSQIGLAVERVLITEAQKKQHTEIETERLRSNLLRAISHDLRTPLTGILGAATTLLTHDKQLSDEQRISLLEDVAEDSHWLIQSVENILSMTRFDEGKLELHIKTELVDDLVLEALNRFKANEKGHKIDVTLPDTVVAVEVDGYLIEQVLVNLVDNAIKYTPSGTPIRIDVTCKEDLIQFRVEDDGSGIAEEHFPLLFNRFFTAGITSDRGKNGIGLGLEICKSIVEAHGGTIHAFNNERGGASFEFILPKRRPTD